MKIHNISVVELKTHKNYYAEKLAEEIFEFFTDCEFEIHNISESKCSEAVEEHFGDIKQIASNLERVLPDISGYLHNAKREGYTALYKCGLDLHREIRQFLIKIKE